MAELNTLTFKSDSALKAYYRFSSGAYLTDSTANAHNLTNVSTTQSASGLYDSCLSTTADQQYVVILDNLDIDGGNITMAGWFKLSDEIGSGYYVFFQQGSSTAKVVNALYYDYNGGTRRLYINRSKTGVADQTFTYNVTLGTTAWHHIVYTYDGSNVKAYLDGIYLDQVSASGNGSGATSDFLYISFPAPGFGFRGYADDICVFNRALTAQEIYQIYAGGGGSFLLNFI